MNHLHRMSDGTIVPAELLLKLHSTHKVAGTVTLWGRNYLWITHRTTRQLSLVAIAPREQL